ncbi:MAG: glutaredoxin family protein [Bacillota bacterium]
MKQLNITVYTQPDCPPCSFVKQLLTTRGLAFTEKDISKNHSSRKELTEKYNAMSTPVVLVNDSIFYNSDLSKLSEALDKKIDT